jgi:membrane protein required for colicin V production
MGELSFTIVDFLAVIVVLVSAIYATWRGLMRETLSIFSWVTAAYVTLRTFSFFRPLLRGLVSPEWFSDALVALGIFLAIFIPLSFISYRFAQSVQRSVVSPVDRTLGFFFGIGRGLVVVGLAYIAFTAFVPLRQQPSWLTEAQTLPLIQNTSDVLLSLVPELGQSSVKEARPKVVPQPSKEARRAVDAKTPTATPKPKQSPKTYGADERRALDRLIETTGD